MADGAHAASRAAVAFGAAAVLTLGIGLLRVPLEGPRPALSTFAAAVVAAGAAGLFRLGFWARTPGWAVLVVTTAILLGTQQVLAAGGHITAYSYPLFVVILFVLIGVSHPPRTSLAVAPVAGVAYVLPLLAEGDTVGTVSVMTVLPIAVVIGEVLAHHIRSLSIARTESERRAALLGVAADAARRMTTLDVDALLREVVEVVCGGPLGFEAAGLVRRGVDGRTFHVTHAANLPDVRTTGYAADRGIVALACEAGSTVVVDDYAAWPEADPEVAAVGIRTMAATPILIDGRVTALLLAASSRVVDVNRERREVLDLLALQAGAALVNAHRHADQGLALRAARKASRVDELTGVGNRRHAMGLLADLHPGDAVLMLDLDHFKEVNDRHGHQIGDRVLADLGRYLRTELRGPDAVARYGGEEFLIVLRGEAGTAEATAVRLAEGWRATAPLSTVSVGVAAHLIGEDPVRTVERADRALYRAKAAGRDRVCVDDLPVEAVG